jgi:hypothetical protein
LVVTSKFLARRVLVLTAAETDGLPEAIHERVARTRAEALAVFDADVLVLDGQLADRARRRFGLPIVPIRAAA